LSRFGRIRRRPDHWASSHERARIRAAERLDGPLGLAESTWLDEHLVGCAACAAVAAAYEADRLALRSLAASPAEPPRDLWARTAAAIERESAANGGDRSRPPRSVRLPLGALSGIAVILVVGASAISSGLFTNKTPIIPSSSAPNPSSDLAAEPSASAFVRAVPTPFAVGAGEVQWVRTRSDGTFAYSRAAVNEVCPAGGQDGCATLEDSADERLSLTAQPEAIIGSPTDQHAIVVSRDAAGRQTIFVVTLPPADDGTISPTPEPTVTIPTVEPTDLPSATPSTNPTPTASTAVGATPSPTLGPTSPASIAQSEAPVTPTPTTEPSSTPTTDPTSTTDPGASPDPSASATPEPTVAASLAIASNIEVVGQSAAFSADGAQFAFTARPADGSRGPDVYVWRIGEVDARPITSDGRSTFGSWVGDMIVVSRPTFDPTLQPTFDPTLQPTFDPTLQPTFDPTLQPTDVTPTSVIIDPMTGLETPAGSIWRPVVDPTGMRAVAWVGAIQPDLFGAWRPAVGRLELRAWSTDPTAPLGAAQIVVDEPVADFDVRWDDSATWFAVWTSDVTDPTLGRLSLFHVDPLTGFLDQPPGAPVEVAALPGFSIGQGRLAWATPPGYGGEGSRVQIVAWTADGVGGIESAPGEDLIVVR